MEREIMTWRREGGQDGLHPLFDEILRRHLMLGAEKRYELPSAEHRARPPALPSSRRSRAAEEGRE